MDAALNEAPADWSRKLNLPSTLPRDRTIYIVTDECEAHEVQYSDDAKYWTRQDLWFRLDGESGHWGADEILGWAESYEIADEAAELLKEAVEC